MAITDLVLLKDSLQKNLLLDFISHFVYLKAKRLATEINCQEAEFLN